MPFLTYAIDLLSMCIFAIYLTSKLMHASGVDFINVKIN